MTTPSASVASGWFPLMDGWWWSIEELNTIIWKIWFCMVTKSRYWGPQKWNRGHGIKQGIRAHLNHHGWRLFSWISIVNLCSESLIHGIYLQTSFQIYLLSLRQAAFRLHLISYSSAYVLRCSGRSLSSRGKTAGWYPKFIGSNFAFPKITVAFPSGIRNHAIL